MTLNTDNAAAPSSNLMNTNDLTTSARDVTAENRAKGHFNEVSTFIPDSEFNNNLNVVIRDGSRVHSGGELRPNDLVMVNGMTMEYETAQAIGAILDGEVSAPQDEFYRDAENAPQPQPTDNRPAEAVLLSDRFELAFGENGEHALNLIGQDIVENGDLSEAGFAFLNEKMGVSEARYHEAYSEMQEVGGRVMSQYLEIGDGLGGERLGFLVDLAETGTREQQEIVRNVWFKAATGKLTREAAIEAFDHLWEPYA